MKELSSFMRIPRKGYQVNLSHMIGKRKLGDT